MYSKLKQGGFGDEDYLFDLVLVICQLWGFDEDQVFVMREFLVQ